MSVRRLKRLMRRPDSTVRGDSGQTLVEYALIIALVSLAAIAALGFLSGRIQSVFSKSGNSLAAVEASIGVGGGGGGSPPPPPPPPTIEITPVGTVFDGATLTATASNFGAATNYFFSWEQMNPNTAEGICTTFDSGDGWAAFGSVQSGAGPSDPQATQSQNGDGAGGSQAGDRCYRATVVVTGGSAPGSYTSAHKYVIAT